MQELLKDQLTKIIRYAYPGFLSLLFVSFVAPSELKTLLDTIGVSLTAVCSIVVGAAIYVGYRLVLGELIIFPLVDTIHTRISGITGLPGGVTSWLASNFKIRRGSRRAAYSYLRYYCHEKSEVRHMDFIHTELHILYLSAVITLGFAIFQGATGSSHALPLGITGSLVLIAACVADIHAHMRERIYFEKVIDSNSVRKILAKGGFIGAEQAGAGQPATCLVVEPENGDNLQPEAEGRSR